MFDFEIEEMKQLDKVYFGGMIVMRSPLDIMGKEDDDIKAAMDDEEGYYEIHIGDHVAYRYEVQAILGKGSFAQVVKAFDHKTGEYMAVKITRNTEIDHKFAASEAKLLNYLMNEDPYDEQGIVRLHEDFFFREHHVSRL